MTDPLAAGSAKAGAGGRLRYLLVGFIVGALAMGALALSLRRPGSNGVPVEAYLALNGDVPGVNQTASGLQYRQLAAGTGGARPVEKDVALIKYEGRLLDGSVFDRSRQPTPMLVAGVVPGFAEALKLMTRGATYRFWIPPALGYGDRAAGPIPAHSALMFDVQLIDFKPATTTKHAPAGLAE